MRDKNFTEHRFLYQQIGFAELTTEDIFYTIQQSWIKMLVSVSFLLLKVIKK